MKSDENVKTLKAAYQLWNDSRADSMGHWLELIAENVRWRSISDGAAGMEFSRHCCSKDDVIRYFEELSAEWELIHYTVDDMIAQDDRVVVLCQCEWKHRRTGKTVETPKADVIRMKEGKISEFFEFFDTAKAIAAASPD